MTHAPGWTWRAHTAGLLERPLAMAQGGTEGPGVPGPHTSWVPPFVGGLCESGWHGDCPQAPLDQPATSCQCSCPCHADVALRTTLF